jgi:flavin-dependent dehydrogenase
MGAGYGIGIALAMFAGIYFAIRTASFAAKAITKAVLFRYKSMKQLEEDAANAYYPLGKYKRPTIMGSTLSGITYFTGF